MFYIEGRTPFPTVVEGVGLSHWYKGVPSRSLAALVTALTA
jgi:hypothetical protein